jgi:hypothetical protein
VTAWTNGFSEWIGHRGVFARDPIACGVSFALTGRLEST